ncbi:MAG TPA: hypothetical protein VNG12_21880 [Acidimicrobiales bacterium]|nr:hypothetical protein [Acidimicrobiales bacterium]
MVSALFDKVVAGGARPGESLPELKPWREVGWIFTSSGTVAVERQDDTIRARSVTL